MAMSRPGSSVGRGDPSYNDELGLDDLNHSGFYTPSGRPRSSGPRSHVSNRTSASRVTSSERGNHQVATQLLSANAAHKKEVQEWTLRCANLEKKAKSTESKNHELMAEVKRLRSICDNQEREITQNRRTVDRMSLDIKLSEQENQNVRTKAKKMEAKLSTPTAKVGKTFNAQKEALSQEVTRLKLDNEEKERYMSVMQEEQMKLRNEIKVLSDAVEMKAEDFGLTGDLKGVLLYDVAKARDESYQHALQIAKKADIIQKLEEKNRQLQEKIDELSTVRDEFTADAVEKERNLHKAHQKLEDMQRRLDDHNQERTVMMDYIQELAEKTSEQQRSMKDAEQDREDLEVNLTDALDRVRTELDARNVEFRSLRKKFEDLASLHRETEKSLTRETEKSRELSRKLEEEGTAEDELTEEIRNLNSEVESLTEVNESLQSEVRTLREEKEEAIRRQLEKQEKCEDQVRDISRLRAERQRLIDELRKLSDANSGETETLLMERDRLKLAVNEAVSKCANSMVEQQKLQAEVEELTTELEGKSRSKTVLQATMAQQISSMRTDLGKSNQERQQLLHANEEAAERIEKLEILLDNERKKVKDLSVKLQETRTGPSAKRVGGGYTSPRSDSRERAARGQTSPHGHATTPNRSPSDRLDSSAYSSGSAYSGNNQSRYSGLSPRSDISSPAAKTPTRIPKPVSKYVGTPYRQGGSEG